MSMATTTLRCTALFAALGALLMSSAARAEDQVARTLVEHALAALPKVPFVATLDLSRDNAEPRRLSMRSKTLRGARASYLEVEAPQEFKGMRFLFIERPDAPPQQFMKAVFTRKPLEILGEIRQRPFLGSTFYIADLVEPRVDDHTYGFVGSEEILGRQCSLVESVPKNMRDGLYGKTVIAIDPKELVVLKRQFFDKNGKPAKLWIVEKIEHVDGFSPLTVQRMTDLRTNEEWVLRIHDIHYNVDIPDSIFDPSYLARSVD